MSLFLIKQQLWLFIVDERACQPRILCHNATSEVFRGTFQCKIYTSTSL